MKLFVVGGGTGLGLCLVQAALREGHEVGYSTSASQPVIAREPRLSLTVTGCDLRDTRQVDRLVDEITQFAPDRLVLCPVQARYRQLDQVTPRDIANDIAFNVSTLIILAAAYARARPAGSVTFLLSHICFLYNPGFTLYKVGKDAVDSFAKAMQFDYPLLKVLRVYPGAMRTNFAAAAGYTGLAVFPPKDPAIWAARILRRDEGCMIGPVDLLFLILSRVMPFPAQRWFFMRLFRLPGQGR